MPSASSTFALFPPRSYVTYVLTWLFIGGLVTWGAVASFRADGRELSLVPVIDSMTSVMVLALLAPFVFRSVLRTYQSRPRGAWRFLAHGLFLVGFSLVHVGGMEALRRVAYRVFAISSVKPWPFVERFAYELPKDARTYIFLVTASLVIILARERASRQRDAAEASDDSSQWLAADGRADKVPLEQVLWLEAQGNYVKFHLRDGAKLIRGTLRQYEAELADHLVRAHRGHLVSVRQVTSVTRLAKGDLEVTLSDGHKLKVSRSYRQNFLARLDPEGLG